MATITTTLGLMDETQLEKREGVIDTEREYTTWVEYRLLGNPESDPIHRSVHVRLINQGVEMASEAGGF